ncbi:unnamed protein product [marine sediment metagenome]|uniref:Uncharacterized protein n=1 Tax=marine sediment metagenome TaxID=412755 RepID=X1SL90_9ZZZZ
MSEKAKEVNEVLSRMGNEVVSLIATSRNLGENYAKLVELLAASPDNGRKEYKETAGFRDRVILVHRDKDGKVIATRDSGWQDHKCLTNTGFASVAGLLLTDVEDTAYDYIGIGTGVVAADPTDTDLGTPVKRKAGTGTRETTTVANDTAQIVVTFAAADTLSGAQAITESGVMNAAAAGTMACRQTFDPLNLNWDAGDSLQVTWKVQAKQGA